MQAQLTGTELEPTLEITFSAGERHCATGEPLSEWVRQWPTARRLHVVRDVDEQIAQSTWQLRSLAAGALTEAGYVLPGGAEEATRPLAGLHPSLAGYARVLPRLTDVLVTGGLLPDSAHYDPGSRSWELPLRDLAAREGISLTDALQRALLAAIAAPVAASIGKPDPAPKPMPASTLRAAVPGQLFLPGQNPAVARAAQIVSGSDGSNLEAHLATLRAATGGIPDWFGLALDPYQVAGALGAAAGHRMLGDAPGLGKTRQILCAAAIMRAQRVIILTPPTVVTHWAREAEASHLADNPDSPGGVVLAFQSTRKIPDLPERGVLIVPDTLIASRPELLKQLIAWNPEVVALDEAHRIKTWDSRRGLACRKLAAAATTLRIAASGTPMFANTEELAGPLDFAGLLKPVFGGYGAFTDEYARKSKFGWTARKLKLPQLKAELDAHCWVRRTKEQVMKDLPPKRRVAEFIDVDIKLFTEAHAQVNRKIDRWLRTFAATKQRQPNLTEIDEWAHAEVGLITLMRRAAGLAKIPAAVAMIVDWVRETTEFDAAGNPVYTRPLIVWTHHHEVSAAMAAALPASVGTAKSIIGGTPQSVRTQIVDDFQAGKIPVLVASIHAAGVGLTLTAASDCLVTECDWTPSVISQLEDRIHRRGAVRPITITTLIAPGTLDEQIQQTLARKARILEEVMTGADHHVATAAKKDDYAPGAGILAGMILVRLAQYAMTVVP